MGRGASAHLGRHAAAVVTLTVAIQAATAQVIGRVSVSSAGDQGDLHSYGPSISGNGRIVAFYSYASNLVPGDTNGRSDVFVHDLQTGGTTRVSVSGGGRQGNHQSLDPSVSADGRFVAFESYASNLVTGDTNGRSDVFVRDRQTGETTRASVSGSGDHGNHHSHDPSISADGRFVAFHSYASNLVAGDTNGCDDVFVHDRQTGQTTRVSISNAGSEGNKGSVLPSISANGRFVAFQSSAKNLVAGDANGQWDIFLHDRQTGETTRVSLSSHGDEANSFSYDPSISGDGRFVAFESCASNLVTGDTNGERDIFVHDRQTRQTTRVSTSSGGSQGNSGSQQPSISADGRFVAFHSHASNLVAEDTNGRSDIFVHDRQTDKTIRVSVSGTGHQGTGDSQCPSISANGRYAAFASGARNLIAEDTNRQQDIFVARNSLGLAMLSWLRTTGYETDGVDPDQGAGGDTRFCFKVLYSDADGHAPGYVSLHLRRNGKPFWEFAMVRGVGDYTTGRVYRRTRKLPPGNYEHCFKARDRDGLATGEATQWTPGPVVGPRTSVALTSLCAVSTNVGTQITFGLSSAAQVQARILNIAGRPVKTLCRARDGEAGSNTLLWNAQSDQGLPVPNGTYLVEVMAKTEDGARARALGQLRLNR
jgi:Tol biopolymer transport system component